MQRVVEKTVLEVASNFGFSAIELVPLRPSTNFVARLSPHDVVVKACRRGSESGMQLELDVAGALVACDIPTIQPAKGFPPVIHQQDDVCLTFWQYISPVTPSDSEIAAIGSALQEIHRCLRACALDLPQWGLSIGDVRNVLADPLPSSQQEQEVLKNAFDEILQIIESRSFQTQPVLGERGLRNWIWDGSNWRACDFETACIGPIENDLCFLPPAALPLYGYHDAQLLEAISIFARLRGAVWCWCASITDPAKKVRAEMHTRAVADWLDERRPYLS